MINEYNIGDNIKIRARFKIKSTGAFFDPPVVEFPVEDPFGGEGVFTYGTDAEVERLGEGDYRFQIAAAIGGRHKYGVRAIDTSEANRSGAAENEFHVKRSAFGNGIGGFGGGGLVIDGGTP